MEDPRFLLSSGKKTMPRPEMQSGVGPANSSADTQNDLRKAQKRAQNRLSQQCVRERRRAQSKHLDTLTAVIESGTSDKFDRQDARVVAQLELIKENEELKDALLRLRKKLLSVSTAAAAAAEDPVFDRIFGSSAADTSVRSRKRKAAADEDETQVNTESVESAVSGQDASLSSSVESPAQPSSFQDQNCLVVNCEPLDRDLVVPQPESNTVNVVKSDEKEPVLSCDSTVGIPHEHYDISQVSAGSTSTIPTWLDTSSARVTPMYFAPEAVNNLFPTPWVAEPTLPDLFHVTDERIAILRHSRPIETHIQVEDATVIYLAKKFDLPYAHNAHIDTEPRHSELMNTIKPMLAQSLTKPGSLQTLDDAVTVSVRLLCKLSMLESYIDGVGANKVMESIMRWRLAPTPANRTAIAEPFRPTAIQTSTPGYPGAIDMVNWPSIRDQLILTLGQHDLGEILKDVVLNTVVDVAAFGVALNVHDVFFNRIAQQPQLLGNGTAQIDPTLPSAQQSILSQIAQGMQASTNSRVRGSEATPCRLSTLYGFDNFHRWRLSHDFARKYDWLNCTGVMSQYPMQPAVLTPAIETVPGFYELGS